MAINSAASAVTVTTPAKDSVNDGTNLPDQTGLATNQIIFPSTLATNNGDLAGSPNDTFVGRLVMIRRGLGTEETKYMTAVSGDGFTASIHENWTTPPSSGDSYDVSYLTWDANTVGARFVVIIFRVTDWTVSVPFVVGDGTNFAFFSLMDGHSIESDNSIGGTQPYAFLVKNNGLLQTGYLASNQPVSAGSWFSVADVVGDPAMVAESGSFVRFYDAFMSCVETNWVSLNGHVIWNKGKVYAGSTTGLDHGGVPTAYTSSDSINLTNFTIEGRSTAAEQIAIDSSLAASGINLISTNGFTTPTTTGNETITIDNPFFVNNLTNITVHEGKNWNVINPIWTINTSSQDEIFFSTSSNNEVNEKYSIDLTTQLADGTLVTGSGIYVYEGLLSRGAAATPFIPTSGSSDSLGEFSSAITTRRFSSGSSVLIVSQSGDFTLKIYKYLYTPFVTFLTVDESISQPITLISDSNITNTIESAALTAGTGISSSYPFNDTTLISWASAPATFSVGESVTGSVTDARGIVVYVPEEDEGAGTGYMLLDDRNSNLFINGEGLTGSLASIGATVSSTQSYAWKVECNEKDLSVVYDYLAAKMAEVPLEPSYSLAVAWGEDEQSQLLYTDGSDYFTERNVNLREGVFLTNYGVGNVSYFTDNNGSTYIPPTQVLLEVYSAASGAQVAIIAEGNSGPEPDGTQIMNEGADESGYASQGYLYKGDQSVVVRARLAGKIPFGLATTVLSDGLSVIALDINDDNYDPLY